MSANAYPWWVDPAALAGAGVMRLLGGTWRIDEVNDPAFEALLAAREPFIYALWHARLLSLTYSHRGLDVAVLISRHRDGELITRIVERLGYVTARGSSTRGGEAGMREMIAWAREGRTLAITPDGPRGPAGKVKPGVVALATLLKLPVVPVSGASSADWRMRSWDRFRVPKPFARVAISHGAPLRFTAGTPEQAEADRRRIEDALEALTRDVMARAKEAP